MAYGNRQGYNERPDFSVERAADENPVRHLLEIMLFFYIFLYVQRNIAAQKKKLSMLLITKHSLPSFEESWS